MLFCPLFHWISLLKLSFFDIGEVGIVPLIQMKRYALQQRIQIDKIHHENGVNLAVRKTVTAFVRCQASFGLQNQIHVHRSRKSENIAAVTESVEENLSLTIFLVLWNQTFHKRQYTLI